MKYKVVEKENNNAVHCICDSKERAERWITINAVEYCEKGYFTNKNLTKESFKIIEIKESK